MTDKPQFSYEDVDLGDEIGPIQRIVTHKNVLDFVSIREENPKPSRFTSKEVAVKEGLNEAIVPGVMNIAMMSQLITSWAPNVQLKKIDVVFRQTVPHNTTLILKGIITDMADAPSDPEISCDITMETEEGVKMVIGNAILTLPKKV
jgi:hypothetical protein